MITDNRSCDHGIMDANLGQYWSKIMFDQFILITGLDKQNF